MPRASARNKSPAARGGGGGGGGGGAVDDKTAVCCALTLTFAIAIGFIVAWQWKILVLLVPVMGIAATYYWAMEQEDLTTGACCLCLVLMIGMTIWAASVDVVDCTACHLDKNSTSWKSIQRHVKRCVACQSKFEQLFGKNSDMFWKKTKSGGAEKIWPDCYHDTMAAWNPCKIHDYVDVELSCKK